MPVVYRIYSNGGLGGAVDYSAPAATVAAPGYTPPPLAAPSDTTFVVRAADAATGLEEANTEARVRIVIDVQGRDISARPNAPHALSVRPTAAGGCRASWAYSPAGQGGPPVGFSVYLAPGPTPDYAAPAASVAYAPGKVGYACDLAGLAGGSVYTVAVRAYNATATESNTTAVASVAADATPPDPVQSLAITADFTSI